jgi:hypothetical protein
MIDFEITREGKTAYLPWAKLCEFAGAKLYQPSTPELVSVKMNLAKRFDINPDNIVVRMNQQPIL